MRKEGTWDRGEDYDKLLKRLRKEIKIREDRGNNRDMRGLNNLYVLITQLKNGARVGEAVEALKKYSETKEQKIEVTIEKRGDGAKRIIGIPKEVSYAKLNLSLINKKKVSAYANTMLGTNTHSLRYAFVGKLSREGRSAQAIAKITGHKNLDEILRYTQQITADDILMEYVED